jgi:hypothetical protein
VPAAPTFDYTVAGQFLGPVIAGSTAGLEVDLTVSAAPGGPGRSNVSRMLRAAATTPTEVHMTLSTNVTFAAIDSGWTCTQVTNDVVCASPSLEQAGNSTILVRVGVGSAVPASASILFEIVTADGGTTSFTALEPVTSPDTLGNPVFATVDHSGLALAGNTVMTCDVTDPLCLVAQGGTGNQVNNNNWNMKYVDADGSTNTTFDSSSSTLTLPPDAEVLYAGLRWSGDMSTKPHGTRGQVLFAGPGLAPTPIIANTVVDLDQASDRYISTADVTTFVRNSRAGTYTVANVAAGVDDTNIYAGWALVVAYRSESAPTRMLLIRDTSATDKWTIPRTLPMSAAIAGLPAVVNGRGATIGVVAFEGDRGLTGDSLTANGSALYDLDQNPINNVFNSSIVLGTGRDPNTVNNFGVDIDRFDTTVPVRPGNLADQTTVTFTFNTDGDQVYLATIVLVVDLDVP